MANKCWVTSNQTALSHCRRFLRYLGHHLDLVVQEDIDYRSFDMESFHTETIVGKDGEIHVDHAPFSKGQAVHVFVSPTASVAKHPLKGSVLKYERPFEPVAEGDWEAR